MVMEAQTTISSTHRFTFKGNQKHTRYGWLRLTPAYSVHLVSELLDTHARGESIVLDPFCGTGTTALACAERGISCDTTDINPFLIWLAQTKARPYTKMDVDALKFASAQIAKSILATGEDTGWLPPLYQIEKWWEPAILSALGRAMCKIKELAEEIPSNSVDLLKLAFCRVAIEQSHVSFGHQSMSFKKGDQSQRLGSLFSQEELIVTNWEQAIASIATAACSPTVKQPRVILCDARELSSKLGSNRYTCVITSPPYPNRMSYIRELRPYLYWLGYLQNQRAAGDLDWQAIGGTWGCATSNVGKWQPPDKVEIPFEGFNEILVNVAKHSSLLSRYIHKYFYDMVHHCNELFGVVKHGGTVNYIVGNSKFYDVILPVEHIYAALFKQAGFNNIEVRNIRKRTSKKELFEFVVSGRKPSENKTS
jgi:hypothetical protein